MSELDEIKQAVEGVRNAVAEAKTASEQAQTMASDKMNEFAGLGLEGVAQVLNTCADTMGTAVAKLGTAFSSCDEAVNGLSGVTDGSQVSVTVAALDGAVQKLTTAGQEVEGAGAQANDALQHAQHSEVEPVMNAVFHAIGQIDQAKATVETTKASASEYRTKVMSQAGTGLLTGASSGGGGHAGQAVPPKPAVPMHSGWNFTPLDAAPPKEREPRAKIGDPIQPPQGGPDDTSVHRAELKSSDDDDRSRRKFGRSGRSAVRNAEALHSQSKETTKTLVIKDRDFFDPPVEETHASVGVADPPPKIVPAVKEGALVDGISNGIVMTVFAVEAFSRRFRQKD